MPSLVSLGENERRRDWAFEKSHLQAKREKKSKRRMAHMKLAWMSNYRASQRAKQLRKQNMLASPASPRNVVEQNTSPLEEDPPSKPLHLFQNESFTISVEELTPPERPKVSMYSPLPNLHSLRLLRIETGQKSHDIITHLHTTDLELVPQRFPSGYEALSYVWGSENCGSNVQDLYLDGQSVISETRQNLKEALERVRLDDQSRVVWADAICINQQDIEERGHQVRLMRSIYRNANRVLVWLGKDDSNNAETAFSVICSIVNSSPGYVDNASKAAFRQRNEVKLSPSPNEGIPRPDSLRWISVGMLFNCQWFWRVWVIQEIVLAKSAVLMWGDFEIDWKWVGIAAAVIRINCYDIIKDHDMEGVYNAYFMHRISLNEQDSLPLTFSFRELLGLTQQFDCTDPRDRIFGLLGLPTTSADPDNGHLFVQPDYSLSIHDLNKRLAWNIIGHDKTLQILSSAQHKSIEEKDLPSWIPQWQEPRYLSLSSTEPAFCYAASGGMALDHSPHLDPDVLAVRGLAVDFVAERPRRYAWVFYDDKEKARTRLVENLVSHLQTSTSLKTRLETSDGRRELCWALSAGKSWDGQLVTDEGSHLGDFHAFLKQMSDWQEELGESGLYNRKITPIELESSVLEVSKTKFLMLWEEYVKTLGLPDTEEGQDGYRFWETAANAYEGRQLFFTKDGSLGLGPAGMQEGDQVCVLFGGEVPFVLRRVEDYYILIGECYLECLMEGQAINRWKNGELKDQLFEIH